MNDYFTKPNSASVVLLAATKGIGTPFIASSQIVIRGTTKRSGVRGMSPRPEGHHSKYPPLSPPDGDRKDVRGTGRASALPLSYPGHGAGGGIRTHDRSINSRSNRCLHHRTGAVLREDLGTLPIHSSFASSSLRLPFCRLSLALRAYGRPRNVSTTGFAPRMSDEGTAASTIGRPSRDLASRPGNRPSRYWGRVLYLLSYPGACAPGAGFAPATSRVSK